VPDRTADRAELLARRLRGMPAGDPAPRIPRLTGHGRPLLSFAQQRLWFMDQLVPRGIGYTMQDARYRLRGPLRTDALSRALNAVLTRQDVLRSRFGVVDGEPHVVIDDPGVVRLRRQDLSGEADPLAAASRVAAGEAGDPFDLARGPLLRPVLLRLGEDDHVLVLTVHHAVFDGWSLEVLERDLSAAYLAALSGVARLPDLPVRYGDFAAWQRGLLTGQALDRELAFWRGQMAGGEPALQLPEDHPRPAVPSYRGGVAHRVVATSTADRLRVLAREHGATLFMTALAAYHVLLSRYARTADIVTGCPAAGRTLPELEDVIGFFVNTLPLRTRMADDPPFTEHLARTRDVTLAAFAHQDVPFERLVEHLAPPRDTSRNPLVQAWFDLFPPDCALELDGVTADRLPSAEQTTRFDLELHATAGDSGPAQFEVVYAKDLFEPATMERFADHYLTLLDAVAANPRTRVGALVMMTAQERHLLLRARNDTAAPVVRHRGLVEWFDTVADACTDATAIAHGDTTVTFAELDRRANRIAHTLRDRGVGPDVVVGLLLPRGVDHLVHLLGVLKAGGAYLPLDPADPEPRIAAMLGLADVRLTVTTEDLAARLPGGTTMLPADYPHRDRPGRPAWAADPGQLAYVICTSGSTGGPKAVAMAHQPLLNLLSWQVARGVTAGPTVQFSSLNFDVSFQEIFATWLAGGALVLLDETERRDPHRMLEVMTAGGVRRLFCPPSVLDELAWAAADARWLPPLTEIMTAGEQLHLGPGLRAMLARLPGVLLDNQYGSTEAQVVTAHRLAGDSAGWPSAPLAGDPIMNVRVYVLDERGRPVEAGVPGELYEGGACLAHGYLGHPDLTAERFVPDPFGPEPGGRLYRTGDLVRWTENGLLQFLGRGDQQVKIRGYRIEPGEVEAVLATHPEVTECAVLPVEVAPGDRRLVGYVVPAAGGHLPQARLRSFLAETLPGYMLPSNIVLLDRLPRTSRGKLDRRALPAPDRQEDDAYLAPRDHREEIIAAIWAGTLSLPRVGVRDDFFELGGHSLLATKIAARLQAAFGIDLPVRTVFTARTVAALAEAIGQATQPKRPPLRRQQARSERPPLSFAQQRLWFLERLRPGSAAYHVARTYRFAGPVDADLLTLALRQVAERQTVLLSRFPADEDGQPYVAYVEPGAITLAVADLSAETEPVATARRLAAAESGRPFDLAHGPLLRALLLRLGKDDHVLVLAVHHAVFDGWSAGVLERELSEAYRAALAGASPRWDPLPVLYADYAVWQRDWLTGDTLESELAYWRERLAGAPPALQLPEDHARPAIPSHHGGTVCRTIPASTVDRLLQIAHQHGATLFMLGLAAYHVLLSRYARSTDIVTGSPVAGRAIPEIQNVAGFFVNAIPLRTSLADDPTFTEHLTRCRDITLDALTHQDMPFEKLVEHLAPSRDTSRDPLAQVWFQLYQAGQEPGLDLGCTRAEPFADDLAATRFDLELHVSTGNDGSAELELVYATDLFEPATMERFTDHYIAVLAAIGVSQDRRVSTLTAWSDGERRGLLYEHNDTAAPVDPRHLAQRFRAVARERCDAVAVSAGQVRLSYAELDRASDRVARTLRDRGVRPGTVAGVALPRGAELIVHLLAVLKAGGAYLPLNPAQPAARIAAILADAAAVTTSAVTTSAAANLAAAPPGELPAPEPDDLAYVVYTSGSTGTPKGVMITLGALGNLVDWHLRTYQLGPDDVVSQVADPTFDAAGWEIWPALLAGARLVVPPGILHDPDALVRHYAEEGVTITFVPTPVGEMLVQRALGAATRLRALLVGGSAFSPRPADQPGVPVINHYGPTEATVVTTASGPLAQPWGTPPIGGPIANTRVYVLDQNGRPVESGVPGELHIGGIAVAQGYLGQPDLTAARFVPDPFGSAPGARLYRTGDLVRWREDGTLRFLGRMDQQVQIRGYRVEPAEVEAALIARPGIVEAAVVPYSAQAGEQLIGYVVATGAVDAELIRGDLADVLPSYMVPAAVIPLDALPKTSSGKVDRPALPAPVLGSGDRTAPRDDCEKALAAIWSNVLGVPDIGVHENFFTVGGHSLLATKVIVRVNDEFGVDLPLSAVFRNPTIACLGAAVETDVRRQVAALSADEVLAAVEHIDIDHVRGGATP
jgi:amino acid adenylation domain-containing protein